MLGMIRKGPVFGLKPKIQVESKLGYYDKNKEFKG